MLAAPTSLQLAFRQLDEQRRRAALLCDTLGLAPQRTPYERVATGSPAELRRFAPPRRDAPPVLLVPAPFKTADIWDLLPAASVVRRYLEAGYRVYLLSWPPIEETPEHCRLGLDDYAAGMLGAAAETVRAETGAERIAVTGHSLGGTLAALFSARYPERVRALTLLAAPLCYGPAAGAFGRLVALMPSLRPLMSDDAPIAGSLLNYISASASPQSFVLSRGADWLASLAHPEQMRLHLLVERWALDERALPGRLFNEIVERLYRSDGFMSGELRIAGRALGPGDLQAPVIATASAGCDIAPPEAIAPALERAGHGAYRLIRQEEEPGVSIQHLGVLVGPRAHERVWPQLLEWLQAQHP